MFTGGGGADMKDFEVSARLTIISEDFVFVVMGRLDEQAEATHKNLLVSLTGTTPPIRER